jgi:hypothetical protein
MFSDEQIFEWKQRYGNIFSVSLGGKDFVFRELTLREFSAFSAHLVGSDSATSEDYLVRTCLLYPVNLDFDTLPAGVVSSIAQQVIEKSGFGSVQYAKELLEHHRTKKDDVQNLMKAYVIASMPAYKEEDLDNLTFNELAKKVALAEQILEINQAMFGVENKVTLDLIDPEEEEAKARAQKGNQAPASEDPIAQRLAQALEGHQDVAAR